MNGQVALDGPTAEEFLRALKTVRKGNFSIRLSPKRVGISAEIAETFNDIVEMNEKMAQEFGRISREDG